MRVPISQRPKTVDSRGQFGHRESDTVIGAAPSRVCIDTQVERKSRRPFARLVPDKSAMATARAEYGIYGDLPPRARIDRTWDNGTEASCHTLVDESLGMLTYFADRTAHGSAEATRTGTAGSAGTCPRKPRSTT